MYAAGDCCSTKQFTHNSDIQARTVLYNALLFSSIDATKIQLPWCTYTDPEIATVGSTEQELKASKTKYTTYTKDYAKLDRAICDSQKGFMKILTKAGTSEILGATFVGGPAGDMIS